MNLVSTRIITANIGAAVEFYEMLMNLPAIYYIPDFVEFKTETATLAIGSTTTLQFFGGGDLVKPDENGCVIIEFLVDDVDKEFERLQDSITSLLVQEPTTMPWGNRSMLIKDPDGNLVNLFTPVTEQAKKKFESNK